MGSGSSCKVTSFRIDDILKTSDTCPPSSNLKAGTSNGKEKKVFNHGNNYNEINEEAKNCLVENLSKSSFQKNSSKIPLEDVNSVRNNTNNWNDDGLKTAYLRSTYDSTNDLRINKKYPSQKAVKRSETNDDVEEGDKKAEVEKFKCYSELSNLHKLTDSLNLFMQKFDRPPSVEHAR